MILPTLRAVLVFTAGIGLALLPTLVDARLWPAWLAYLLVALLACGVDSLLLLPPRATELVPAPEAPVQIYVGTAEPLRIHLRAPRWRIAASLEVLCESGALLEPQPAATLRVPAGGKAEASVLLKPRRRGTGDLRRLWIRSTGPLGLACRVWTHPLGLRVPVVPDVRAVRAAALRFFGSRESVVGVKTERYVGDGSEFDSLRKFVPGLDSRGIDWKATARHRSLLCRQFRAERNHQVILALDTGHLMSEPVGGAPRIDHAIHSGLLMAYVGLRTGDRVGMAAFDSRLHLFLQPRSGAGAFHELQRKSASIEYGKAETNYTLSTIELLARLRRRSLVVVFTDFVDSITAELMLENVDRLARKHLVLFVTSRDPALERTLASRPESLLDLNRSVVAADVARERALVFQRLRVAGVQIVDAPSERVPVELLNRYLEIRRRELV